LIDIGAGTGKLSFVAQEAFPSIKEIVMHEKEKTTMRKAVSLCES